MKRRQDKLDTWLKSSAGSTAWKVTTISWTVEPDAAQRLWNETSRRGLRVDVLVNNAGFGTGKDVTDGARTPGAGGAPQLSYCGGLTARYLAGHTRAQEQRDHQHLLRRSLPANAPHGRLRGLGLRLSFTEALWRDEEDGIRGWPCAV